MGKTEAKNLMETQKSLIPKALSYYSNVMFGQFQQMICFSCSWMNFS